jgi:hypothetical protein
MDYGLLWSTIFAGLSLVCYLGGAIFLTLLAANQFDRVAGRARRPLLPRPEPVSGKPAAQLEPAISE